MEAAQASLEKAYRDHGYQTVAVQVPPQSGRRGIVVLQVVEQKVGRLRVRGIALFLAGRDQAPRPVDGRGHRAEF